MAELFDGYIPSKCKIPLYSLNEKSPLDKPPLVGDYVGVLKNGIVQVDIDEMEFAQIVLKIVQDYKLKCDVLQTSRGLHFYFKCNDRIKKQKVHWYNAIGIPTDYGIGDRNRVVPLKVTETIEQTKILNGQEQDYKDWYNKNLDPYGHACFTYAERWAEMLENAIENSTDEPMKVIVDNADRLSHEADIEGITGFMYGMAVSILSQCWKYGEELRKWHNKEYNYDGDGVVNPAVLTIG